MLRKLSQLAAVLFFVANPLPAYAEADGPDFYSVTGVSASDVLNIRNAPNASAEKIGEIPSDGDGLRNLGCEGQMSFAEWEKATQAERDASAKKRWCQIEYGGTQGWVAGWFLAEGSAPSMEMSKPAFDCSKAEGEVETTICADPWLGRLDQELSRLYHLAGEGEYVTAERLNELKAYQRGWIKGRNDCWKATGEVTDCIADNYAMRIDEIRTGYANARSDDGAGISQGPFAYVCEGLDAGLSASFIATDPAVVALKWRDNNVELTQVRTGSGVKYEGETYEGSMSFWTKGKEAMLAIDGQPDLQCQQEEIG